MISIIVPIYNSEKYLQRCVDSIVCQSYKKLEIILIDDGSNDSSLRICQNYALNDSRICVIAQANAGVSSARNHGLSMASGEYIMFVDSDDYMFPNMCELMLNCIEKKNADLVVCGTTETYGCVWAPEEDRDYRDVSSFMNDFIKYYNSELLSPPWNKIYRKKLIVDKFVSGLSFGEDLIFNLNYLLRCNSISFITATPFYHEKDNDSSLVRKISLNRLNEIERVYSEVLSFYKGDSVMIHAKYVRDIVNYFCLIVGSKNHTFMEKLSAIKKWRRKSKFGDVELLKLPLSFRRYVISALIKINALRLAYSLVRMSMKS